MLKNKLVSGLATLGLVAGALIGTAAPAMAGNHDDTGHTQINVCHAQGPNQPENGWTVTPVDDSSVVDNAHFTLHDYDIVPITAGTPSGKNLDTVWGGYTGAEILANGCELPSPPVVDLCTNIDGDQATVPDGYTVDGTICSPPVVDVCSNIDGDQATVPDGYTSDDGECFEDEGDPDPDTYSFCHATEVVGAKNGWLALGPLPAVAIVNGHGNHAGDIIPVIDPDFPNGQNLDTLYPNYGPGVTGADILELGCPDSPDVVEPDVATASLSFYAASCFSEQTPNIAGSPITNAVWGTDTDPDPLSYSIVATATGNALFDAGPGVSGDRLTKTFTGSLDPIFPQDQPPCVLGLVMPSVTFVQATCAADGSYTLGVANGYDPTLVTFTVNGTPGVLAGTYKVVGAQNVTVTAQAVAPNGLELEWVDPPTFGFVNPTGCGDLTTLSLPTTGATTSYLGWVAGGSALFLGLALLLIRRRREASTE